MKMMIVNQKSTLALLAVLLSFLPVASSFHCHPFHLHHDTAVVSSFGRYSRSFPSLTQLWEEKIDGVVELSDEEETSTPKQAVAPFMSQGEIAKEEMDLSDPKQARVMFYIILSLLPVLFLIPLMLGSRDLIPPEMLPPVELN